MTPEEKRIQMILDGWDLKRLDEELALMKESPVQPVRVTFSGRSNVEKRGSHSGTGRKPSKHWKYISPGHYQATSE